jgi:ribonuclease R
MTVDQTKLIEIVKEADHPLGIKEVLDRAGMHPGQLTEVKRALRDLVRSGEIIKEGKRFCTPEVGEEVRARKGRAPTGERIELPPKPVLVYAEPVTPAKKRGKGKASSPGQRGFVGLLRKHRDGFAFVERYDGEGDDVFVAAAEAAQVFDGDLVRVEEIPGSGGRTQGKILEVVERRRQYALGTYVDRSRQVFVLPTDPALGAMIAVDAKEGIRDGDVVKVRLTQPGAAGHAPPRGEVVAKAGNPGDPRLEVLRAAFAQGFSDDFPESVLHDAELKAKPVDDAAWAGRRDSRALALVTIDGEDARDFDDAVYVERAPAGYRLVVAIADVSHYVEEGAPLDDEALRRGTSVYFPNAVLPMLPEALSNGICSLKPDEDRLCMVADMILDESGKPLEAELYPSVMKSRARCTYTEVAALLGGKDVPHRNFLKEHMELSWELAKKLNRQRQERGSIDFDIPEAKVVLDEQGKLKGVEKRERNDAHRLVEEFMLAANEAVARYFSQRGLPTIYRVHGSPDEEKLASFTELARTHGINIPEGGFTPHALNALLAQVQGQPYQRAFNSLLLRAMMQATYESENIGHYGLAAEDYLHFTSPIRRYPDLVVHRLLKQHWKKGGHSKASDTETARLQAIARRCSERERAAMKAERDVDAFFGCLLLKDKIGQRFSGVISSVTDFGLFVELDGLFVEGLIKAEELGSDTEFEATTQTLTVGSSGKHFTVGDRIEVEVRSVNLERRQTDLALIEAGQVVGGRTRGRTLSEALDALKAQRGYKPKPERQSDRNAGQGQGQGRESRSKHAEGRNSRSGHGGHGGHGGRDSHGGHGGRDSHGGHGGRDSGGKGGRKSGKGRR